LIKKKAINPDGSNKPGLPFKDCGLAATWEVKIEVLE
jgi:hypothetical protein